MGYVMVPVPEEFVEDAMRMILRLSHSDRMNEWDEEAVTSLFNEATEMEKAVLSAVARGSLTEEESVKEEDLPRSMEHTLREVREIAKAINERAIENDYGRLIAIKSVTETLPNGRTREERRFAVQEHVAEWIREAERAEARSARNPLLGEG